MGVYVLSYSLSLPAVKTFNALHFKVRCNAVYITSSYHQIYSEAFILIKSALKEQTGVDFSKGFKDIISYHLFTFFPLRKVSISKTTM